VLYVAVAVSKWWIYALTLPLLLVWQWISLRRQANDALVAAFVAKEPGGENAASEIRNTAMTELLDYEASSRRDHALRAAAERGAAHTRPVTSSPTKRSSGT
jgi:hypothetical protein